MTLGPEDSIMINRCRILDHFKWLKNTPLGDLFIFLIFSAVPTFKTSFHMATEYTIKRSRFKKFLSIMHLLASLISKFSQPFNFLWNRNSGGGGGTNRPFSFFDSNLVCLFYAPGYILCKDASKTVEAVKYLLQRRRMLIPCHNMIKIMHSNKFNMFIISCALPDRKFGNRHCSGRLFQVDSKSYSVQMLVGNTLKRVTWTSLGFVGCV